MGDITQAKASDPMLAVLGQTGSLEELKEERISLQLARGRCYDILSSAFSYPWNRKFFRPKFFRPKIFRPKKFSTENFSGREFFARKIFG